MPCDGKFKQFKCSSCHTEMNACSWSVSYAEGSEISGFIATDKIVFGDEMQSYIEEEKTIEKVILFFLLISMKIISLFFILFSFAAGKS